MCFDIPRDVLLLLFTLTLRFLMRTTHLLNRKTVQFVGIGMF